LRHHSIRRRCYRNDSSLMVNHSPLKESNDPEKDFVLQNRVEGPNKKWNTWAIV